MSDLLTLLNACKDEPADDGPRLILADWLEEHGESDRAEFIRLQLALARLPEWASGRAELSAREADLLNRHRAAWSAPLRPFGIVPEALCFQRGLLGFGNRGGEVDLSRVFEAPWDDRTRAALAWADRLE